jgi:hypothetical protein
MKYIIIPPHVPIEQLDGTPVKNGPTQLKITFREFMIGRLADPKWGSSADHVLNAGEIRTQVRGMPDIGGVLVLETEHWKQLLEVTNSPSPQVPYNPQIAHCLSTFIKAVQNAKDEKPAALTDPPNDPPQEEATN